MRIGRIFSTYLQFKDRHYTLTAKLVKQGFGYGGLCRAFRRFSRIHASIFSIGLGVRFLSCRGYSIFTVCTHVATCKY